LGGPDPVAGRTRPPRLEDGIVLRVAVLFSLIIVAYDALAATIAKALIISYNSFLVPALVLFFFMGIYAGRKSGSWSGTLVIVIVAAVDATLGWYVAALIGPGYVPGWTMRQLIVLGFESAVVSTAIGAVGVWIGLAVAGVRRRLF
jgi:hypothetical protein